MATPDSLKPSVNSPFGNRPRNLPNPVPPEGIALEQAQTNAQAASNVDGIQAPNNGLMDPADAAMTAPMQDMSRIPATESVDDIYAQLDALGEGQAAPATGEAQSTMPEPTGLASLREQFSEAGARIKNAFAVTPLESVNVLKSSGVFDDARVGDDGDLEVKRKGRGGWEKLDRDKLELVGDTLDWARDAMEMVIEGGIEAGATAAGLVTGPGAIGANIAGGATGAVIAKNAGDLVAQQLLGIEQDPSRGAVSENALAAGFGAGFGFMGSMLARRAAARIANKTAADKSISNVMETVNGTMQEIEMVRNSGIKIDADGKFRVDPNVASAGLDPEAKANARYLSDTDGYRNFFDQMGNSLQSAFDSLSEAVSNMAGKNANIGKDFVMTADTVRKAEGKLIGDYAQFADKATRSRRQASPRTLQTLDAFKTELGNAKGIISVESAIENLGLDESKAKMLVSKINKVRMNSKRGQMSVDTSRALYDDLTRQINRMSNMDRTSTAGRALIDLKNAVRDDWVDMVENVLPDSQKGNFIQSRARYREIMQATDNLGNLLNSSDISKDVLVKKLFEGKDAWQNIQGVKTLMEETNPELWQNLSLEYFNRLKRHALEETTSVGADGIARVSTKYNWNSIDKAWGKLDERVRNELATSTGFGTEGIQALMNLGKKYQNADVGFAAKESTKQEILSGLKNVVSTFLGGGAAQGTAAVNTLSTIGKDGALLKFLQADGNLEALFRRMKKSDQGAFKTFENAVYNWSPPKTKTVLSTESRRASEDSK